MNNVLVCHLDGVGSSMKFYSQDLGLRNPVAREKKNWQEAGLVKYQVLILNQKL